MTFVTARIAAHTPAPSSTPMRRPFSERLRRSGTSTTSSRRGWALAQCRENMVSLEARQGGPIQWGILAIPARRRDDTGRPAPCWRPASARCFRVRTLFEDDDCFLDAPTFFAKLGDHF